MAGLQQVKLVPILGRKTNCPADNPLMFKAMDNYGRILATHDAGGMNFDFIRSRRACSKCSGYKKYTVTPNAQATKCLGLFELWDGTYRDYIMFDNGKVYVVNQTTLALDDITPSGVTFANDDTDIYSIISFGGYMVFSDFAEHTPYKWHHGDAECTKLIQSGTEYKFRYLEEYHGRIIGAYSDQTNGDLEIRWTDALPNWASLDFPAANQLYKPVGDDSITGLKRLGTDACILYADNSINRIEYYNSTTAPFAIVRTVANFGGASAPSIVATKSAHWLFCSDYGFCRYDGGAEFPSGGTAISEDIEEDIKTITRATQQLIVGTYMPIFDEICWTVPLNQAETGTHLAFYNPNTQQWRFEDKAMKYVDTWLVGNSYTWSDWATDIGGGGTWDEIVPQTATWGSLSPQINSLVHANADGYVYVRGTEANDGTEIDGHRFEPVMDFGDPLRKDTLLEIWLDIVTMNNVAINIYWRGGDTLGELLQETWEELGSVMCTNVCGYLPAYKTARYQQIKWGTDGANEPFDISGITLKYIPQGYY